MSYAPPIAGKTAACTGLPARNRLLAELSHEGCDRIAERARLVVVPAGEVVCEPGRPFRFVHFPITGVLSSIVCLKDGTVVETVTIGNEGMAGLAAIIDDRASPYRVVQRIAGEALLVPTGDFRRLLGENDELRDLVRRYALALLHHHAQNAACNLHHDIEGRMCRWLLTTADRTGGDGFAVTQEFLGEMLGVSRQSVNVTAGALQESGLIAYRRGRLRITDRPRLEAAACECYRATREAYERLMRPPAA